MTSAFRINFKQYTLDGPSRRTRRTMHKNPVTISYFNPVQAVAARNKALELADGAINRLIMIRPDVYVVMNSSTHAVARPKVIKQLRKEHGLA
jgi:hypothetical protein